MTQTNSQGIVQYSTSAESANGAQNTDTSKPTKSVQEKQRQRQIRALYLTGSVVVMFAVLWFPWNVGRVLMTAAGYTSAVSVTDITVSIGMLNASFNWLVYGLVNTKFRQAYWKFLSKLRNSLSCTKRDG